MMDVAARFHGGPLRRGCATAPSKGSAASEAGNQLRQRRGGRRLLGSAAFRKGLDESGYVDGRNVTIEYHWVEANVIACEH